MQGLVAISLGVETDFALKSFLKNKYSQNFEYGDLSYAIKSPLTPLF